MEGYAFPFFSKNAIFKLMKKFFAKRYIILFYIPLILTAAGVGFSFFIGEDWIGGCLLVLGFLVAYYSTAGHILGFIFTIPSCVLWSYIGYINGFYATMVISVLAGIPLAVLGIVQWKKNNGKNFVLVNAFTLKKGTLITLGVIGLAALLGFGLSYIPSQNASYLNSFSQILNIFACILFAFRYREAWFIYLATNLVDIALASYAVVNHLHFAWSSLAQSLIYTVNCVIGITLWYVMEKRQKKQKLAARIDVQEAIKSD